MAPRFWLLSRVCRLCPPVWLSQLTTATALLYNAFAVLPPIWGCYRCGHHEGWASKWRLGQTSWCFSSKEQIHWHHVLCVVCGFWFSLHMSTLSWDILEPTDITTVCCSVPCQLLAVSWCEAHTYSPCLVKTAKDKGKRSWPVSLTNFPWKPVVLKPMGCQESNHEQPAASQIHWNLVHQCAPWEPWQLLKTLLPAPMLQCLRCCTEPSADCNLLAPGFPCTNSEPPDATGTLFTFQQSPRNTWHGSTFFATNFNKMHISWIWGTKSIQRSTDNLGRFQPHPTYHQSHIQKYIHNSYVYI